MIRKGSYVLFLTISDTSMNIGSLGMVSLCAGEYCYVGSAKNGLDQRLSRHMSNEKKMHWHIDRLTMIAKDMDALESSEIPECELCMSILDAGGVAAIKGFGCSDCHCISHLFHVSASLKEKLHADPRLSLYTHA